jgi:hypothetical protein
MNPFSQLTVAMLRTEANFVALMVMAERVLKEADQVINDYRAAIAHMKRETKPC